MKRSTLTATVLSILGLCAISSAMAANFQVHVCARPLEKDLTPADNNDNEFVTMWGYSTGRNEAAACNLTRPATSPGPRINIPLTVGGAEYDGLTVVLHNRLRRPTSLVIPGTVKAEGMSPVYIDGSNPPRVRSFDVEAPPGGSATYTWDNLAPGTYMYHSGTHPQLQVQMGLYGAITNDAVKENPTNGTLPEAYPGVSASNEIILFYSEIDRALHDDVVDQANGFDYDETDMRSTIDYAPKHFMVDVETGGTGVSFDNSTVPPTLIVDADSNPLVRILNAGHQIHVPTLMSGTFDIHAEDGKAYPAARTQYSVEMPPLKTRDATLNPADGSFRLLDSAMALSNPNALGGAAVALASGSEISNGNDNGMVLDIVSLDGGDSGSGGTPSADAPDAQRDQMSVREGGTIRNILAQAMNNDTNAAGTVAEILSYPAHGELVSNGSDFSYIHGGGEDAVDSLIYQLSNAAGESSFAGVIIDVAPVNDAPLANDDSVTTEVGKTIEIRALYNDEDADSDSIRITGVDDSSLGAIGAQDQVIVFSAESEGSETLAYSIADSDGGIASASIHLTVNPAEAPSGGTFTGNTSGARSVDSAALTLAPVATNDSYRVRIGGTIDVSDAILGVMANDTPNGQISTDLVRYPGHGAVSMNPDGTFTYTHDGSAGTTDRFVYEIYNEAGVDQGRVDITIVIPAQ